MPLPEHLFVSDTDGALYDTRQPEWHKRPPLRALYQRTCRNIETPAELKATLRAGPWAWPGGYPMFLVMADGEALSFQAAEEQLAELLVAFKSPDRFDGWRVVGTQINYEDDSLTCAHTGKRIQAAYSETG
jgi:hypothetical protein